MVCEPAVTEEKVYVAEPLVRGRAEVSVAPSTVTVKVPEGLAVLELEADATAIVTMSLAPEAGVKVAAESVVVVATDEELVAGHAINKLWKSIEPRPVASS